MKAQRSSDLDRISALPQPIIENILCRLPIQDAGRTSILSRIWRYTWTKIPKLSFNECGFQVSTCDNNEASALEQPFFGIPSQRRNMTKRCKFFYAIYQVLLLHQGPVDVFSLSMKTDETCVELDQIILHLSRSNNTLKNFTLCCFRGSSWYRLPSSFFSLNHLTHLSLHGCHLYDQPMLKGFSSLTTLYLDNVDTSRKTLLRFLSSCPLIKRLTLLMHEYNILGDGDDDDDDYDYFDDDDNDYYDDNANITELLDCLHVIEHLCIGYWAIQCFAEDRRPQKLPPALAHLKSFCLVEMCFAEEDFYGLPFVGLVIRNSPNLEKLRLTISLSEIESINLEDFSDIWLEHLKELEIEDFVNMKHELEFVKLILAKSPVLKKVSILLKYEVTTDEEMMVLRILLCSPHASPHVKIFVERHPDGLTEV